MSGGRLTLMQRLKKCLGIDVGTTSVKIAELVAEKQSVRVTRMFRGEVPLPPGPLDGARMDELAKLVRQIISDNKITTKHAVFSVPGQNVFIRRIRFPRTSEERMHRIVAYEAKQQIPFPPEHSLMEYQVFDYGDQAEVEVLLAAIKTDIVSDFMKLVNKCGLKPVMISVTSLALFNFHVFDSTAFPDMLDALKEMNNPSSSTAPAPKEGKAASGKKGFALPKITLGKKKKLTTDDVTDATMPEDMSSSDILQIDDLPASDDLFEDVKAYINIGSQTFDLAIARHGKRKMLGFTRSVPYAGAELTRMLTNQMGVDPAQADDIKKSQITIPSSLDLEPVPDGPASEIALKWADRIVLEIRKSFDFYIAQPDGMAVDGITLSGGGAELNGLAAFIEDKLGVPVELRETPTNPDFIIAEPAAEESALTTYLVSFGLGLSGLGFGHVNADFLPQDMKTMREFKKKKLELAGMAALLLAMVGLSTQIGTAEIRNMRNWAATNSGTLEKARADRERLGTARAAREKVSQDINAVGQALGDRAFILQIMSTIEAMKPAGVAFSQLNIEPDGNVIMEGASQSQEAFTNFLNALKTMPDLIDPASVEMGRALFAVNLAGGSTQQNFRVTAKVPWKRTRLEPARVTLTPGLWTPTPTPSTDPNMMGDPMMMGGPAMF